MGSERRPMEGRRTEIADAALKLIGTRGIAALTMATLAAEVGVTAGALFKHYASRDEILEAAALRAESMLAATAPPPGLPPLERLRHLLITRSETVGRDPGLATLMLSDQFTMALPKKAASRLLAVVARTRSFVAESLRDAMSAGQIRDDVDPDMLAIIVIGTMQAFARSGSSAHGAAIVGESTRENAWKTIETLLAPARPPHSKRTGKQS